MYHKLVFALHKHLFIFFLGNQVDADSWVVALKNTLALY